MNLIPLPRYKAQDPRLYRRFQKAIERRDRRIVGPVLLRLMCRWMVDEDGLRELLRRDTEQWLNNHTPVLEEA
jgi:hypothetical protein